VIFIAGLSAEWESEGFDRPSLQLPGQQDEVIARVAEANPNTVVCIQAGSAVSMPWVGDVNGLLQTWYSGNEVGNAIADVIYGKVNPCGRLPLTLPVRMEDVPSYLSLRSENGKIHYREDLFVGYKHYQARHVKPMFSFGYGLSYSRFSLSNVNIIGAAITADSVALKVSITVKNDGQVTGSEVVQLYVAYPETGVTHPVLQLKGFVKAHNIAPGTSKKVSIELDKYAMSFWDSPQNAWRVAAGTYKIHIGFNCDNLVWMDDFEVKKGFLWTGL